MMATEIMNNEVGVGESESKTPNSIEKLDISKGNDDVSENSSSKQLRSTVRFGNLSKAS